MVDEREDVDVEIWGRNETVCFRIRTLWTQSRMTWQSTCEGVLVIRPHSNYLYGVLHTSEPRSSSPFYITVGLALRPYRLSWLGKPPVRT